MWSFNKHKKARFGYDNEHLWANPERITYMNFNQWKAFYMGDPEHWNIIENSNMSNSHFDYRIPMYRMNKNGCWENRYVKFLTAADYRKFNTFIDDQAAKGEDYENLQEIAEFAGCSFFQSFVPNQNQSTIFQTKNILTRKSHDTSTN